jgi:aminopeptidase N
MEYPMMTCIGGARDSTAMYGVTLHEIAHMWFPMQVGSNEKRHSWMDEGLTQFNESQGSIDFFGGTSFVNDVEGNRDSYLALARSGSEVEMMRHGDLYGDRAAFGIASYFKPATLMVALRGILGEETFNRAYREYGARWRFRHPSPYDFFSTFESVSGRDLDWFWRPWFFETWTLDQAIAGVEVQGDSVAITVEDRGLAPMPVRLSITRQGAPADTMTVPADVWLDGARRHTIKVPARGGVTRVVIDAEEVFPDLDRTNQTWSAGAQ